MLLNGPNGDPVDVTPDKRLKTVSVTQTDMNAMARQGLAWTLPFTQSSADITDNVVFHIENTGSDPLDVMRLLLSTGGAGLWTIEHGRAYSSGGAAVTLAQLNAKSGKTQDVAAYYGQDITLTGTAVDVAYLRVGADSPFDILNEAPVVLPASGTMALRFAADASVTVMAVTPILHGKVPWV